MRMSTLADRNAMLLDEVSDVVEGEGSDQIFALERLRMRNGKIKIGNQLVH